MMLNAQALARFAVKAGIPVVLSTVGVQAGVNQPTLPQLREEIPDLTEIDRTSMNAWDDPAFRAALLSTGRSRFVMCGLWTEICLAFPVVDMQAEDLRTTFPADAVGGTAVPRSYTVYGRIPAGQYVAPGSYGNTITVTVTY